MYIIPRTFFNDQSEKHLESQGDKSQHKIPLDVILVVSIFYMDANPEQDLRKRAKDTFDV